LRNVQEAVSRKELKKTTKEKESSQSGDPEGQKDPKGKRKKKTKKKKCLTGTGPNLRGKDLWKSKKNDRDARTSQWGAPSTIIQSSKGKRGLRGEPQKISTLVSGARGSGNFLDVGSRTCGTSKKPEWKGGGKGGR